MGAGIFYDNVGQPIAIDSDLSGSPGLASPLIDPSQEFTLATAPRFSGSCSLTASCTGLPAPAAPFFTPPAQITYPYTPVANTSNLGFAVDPGLRTPYSLHFNADIQRELPHHFVVDVGYVGTLGRRLLGKADFAQYLNIKDPKSGQDLFSAFRQIAQIANMTPQNGATPAIDPTNFSALAAIKDIPFFTNMLPGMGTFAAQWLCSPSDSACNAGYSSLSPTQAFYAYSALDAGPSYSCALFPIDTFVSPGGLTSPWNSTVDPNGTGFVLFTPQFSSLPGWTNWSSSNYHSLQVSVRKSTGIASFAANYVFSKGIDNASGGENGDLIPSGNGTLAALIQNPFNHRLGRSVSDFNLRHNFNGDVVLDLPFGHGRHYFSGANRVMDALVGGWQVSAIARWRSGFPESPGEGFNFPTNFFLETPGTFTSIPKSGLVHHGAFGVPNLFSDPNAAYNDIAYTLPGLAGSRNVLTGPAFAAADIAVSKAFRITERQTLRFQVRAYNVFNSVNFDDSTLALDPNTPGTFGNLTGTSGPRGGAREMEFGSSLRVLSKPVSIESRKALVHARAFFISGGDSAV